MFLMERIEDRMRGLSYFRPVEMSVDEQEDNFAGNQKLCQWCTNVEWTWDAESNDEFVNLVNHNRDVRFHQNFSRGTAIVRGSQPMSDDQFYWEVKLIQPVYGTDIMVGVGTSEADMSQVHDKFLSILGMDNKTWGLSYTGLFYHCGEAQDYAPSFSQGNVIGIHLDLWRGTLSFYKDKKHLGVASSGLKGKTLYGMASSTAARSGMRILRCSSFPSSLQFLCCLRLRDIIPNDRNVLDVIDIPSGLRRFLSTNLDWLLDQCNLEKTASDMCKHGNLKSNKDKKKSIDVVANFCNQILHSEPSKSNSIDESADSSGSQFVLLGSVPYSFRNFNRFQAIRRNCTHLSENDRSAKRLHYSYNYSIGLSDTDSDYE
ncbi:SPRY domain-containing SOCS box protein 3-like [Uloborus diversus]|uniref:SPRY domain-containing SOCS box protein 3-like n=1 Tax=Uloborus diversus TaxID=327109 RepID=UPI002409241B|nr:SPRY domain-containing SOCS box protein 3-like [Uloborus diversus]